MAERWRVLAVLFAVRSAMAFQFQAVAALSPVIETSYGVGIADVGMLFGLYLAPGIVFALPGGAIGQRFGDRLVVVLGLALMIAGGALMAVAPGWSGQIAGRLLAGAGGVLLNVLMSKIVADWFAGREIATAMSIFVNSWPLGIGLALLVLPPVAGVAGLAGGAWLVTAICASGFVLMLRLRRDPPDGTGDALSLSGSVWPKGRVLALTLIAGAIWGLFNAALAMIFGFGPAILVERGYPLAAASSQTSLVLWAVALFTPLGGIVADRTGRSDLLLGAGLLCFAAALALTASMPESWGLFALVGALSGLCAGPIMGLPAMALPSRIRATGMGLFFTLYYLIFVIAPTLAGRISERAGTASAALEFGAALAFLAFLCLAAFFVLLKRTRAPAPPEGA